MLGWNRSKHLEYVQCVGPISGMHKFFPKVWGPPENSGHQKGDMKQVLYRGPTNVRLHRRQISYPDSLTPGIYAPMMRSIRDAGAVVPENVPYVFAACPLYWAE